MKTQCLVAAGICCASLSALPQSITLNFLPAVQNVGVGSPVEVALTVSGLGAGTAPSIGVFDLDVTYNPSVLQFDSVAFADPALGDQLDLMGFGSISSFDASTPGVVNHFELSLDPAPELDSLQASFFTLSVFRFTALAPGTSPLDLVINAIGDANGDPLPADFTPGSIFVPEPAAGGLLFGLIALAWLGVGARLKRL